MSSNMEKPCIKTFLFAFYLTNIQGPYSTYNHENQMRDGIMSSMYEYTLRSPLGYTNFSKFAIKTFAWSPR